MDEVIDQLADFCVGLHYDDLPEDVVDAATERLVDSVACAVGGLHCDAASLGRRLQPVVHATPARPAMRSLGESERRTTVEAAGFVTSAMIRYLDFNDTFPGGHPSDALGPIISLADGIGSSGKELITSLVAGYEIFIRFAATAKLRELGWDQGFGIGLATAAGMCKLLGLDREQTAHALRITAVSIVPMRATRAGELSLWKGAATSFAASNAAFATLLAAEGMTGPEAPIDGRHGLKDLVTGPFELQAFGSHVEDFVIRKARIKFWPVEYHLQAVVWAGVELGRQCAESDLASVDIATYWSTWHETASEPAKWDPRTRETADHSLPYVFVRAFQEGALELSAFERDAYLDPDVRATMDKVSARVDDELQEAFPDTIMLRATARTTDGREHEVEIINPRGHEENPVTTVELADKFTRLVEPVCGSDRTATAMDLWTRIRELDRVADAVDVFAGIVDENGEGS